MKLSTMLGYSGDVLGAANEIAALESAGLDCVWASEAYSFDAISIMGYLAARTERVEIGSAIVNVYTRTPTLLAMTFAGLDSLSGGRVNCGLGASGPQVIEGFHGVAYDQPMRRIRETIDVMRATWRREVVEYHGRTIDIPLPPDQGTGLGKALKLINHPVRQAVPIWWASLLGRSVEATAEVADGWIPTSFVPERAALVWGDALAAGARKRSSDLAPLQILAGGPVLLTEDAERAARYLDSTRPHIALYVGGMGARGKNFYNDILSAYGWEKEAREIQDLYLEGKKDEAAALVPAEYLNATSLVGPAGHVRERLASYREAGVTHLQLGLSGSLADKVATVEKLRALTDS